MSKLLELAERCEQATGPDRDLSIEIQDALYPNPNRRKPYPDYTASIDAALTLVPEGDNHDLEILRTKRGAADGFKLWQARYSLDSVEDDPEETGPIALGEAATPALAICAAALRARHSRGGHDAG